MRRLAVFASAILAEQGEKAAVIGRVTDTEGVVIR